MWTCSTSARIGALVIGFALGLLACGLANTGLRAVPAPMAETIPPENIDLERFARSQLPNRPGMRLASLEMSVGSYFAVEDAGRPAFIEPRASFSEVFSSTSVLQTQPPLPTTLKLRLAKQKGARIMYLCDCPISLDVQQQHILPSTDPS